VGEKCSRSQPRIRTLRRIRDKLHKSRFAESALRPEVTELAFSTSDQRILWWNKPLRKSIGTSRGAAAFVLAVGVSPREGWGSTRSRGAATSLATQPLQASVHALLLVVIPVCVRTVPSPGDSDCFPTDPALRLRLRAGLRYSVPSALRFRCSYSTAVITVWFSRRHFSPTRNLRFEPRSGDITKHIRLEAGRYC
jgi:hypothetical protein